MLDTLLLTADRRRLYLLTPVPVSTHLGDGVAVYVHQDGYVGVRLHSETRVEEVSKEHVVLVPVTAATITLEQIRSFAMTHAMLVANALSPDRPGVLRPINARKKLAALWNAQLGTVRS